MCQVALSLQLGCRVILIQLTSVMGTVCYLTLIRHYEVGTEVLNTM